MVPKGSVPTYIAPPDPDARIWWMPDSAACHGVVSGIDVETGCGARPKSIRIASTPMINAMNKSVYHQRRA